MHLRHCAAASLLLLSAMPGLGLTAHQVADVNPQPLPGSSSPGQFFTANGVAVFTALDDESRAGLWRSDGTPEGTFPLVESCPNECFRSLWVFAQSPHRAFLFASGNLWSTDGTREGTVQANFGGALVFNEVRPVWLERQGALFFAALDNDHGRELWRTDATLDEPSLVADLWPGLENGNPADLTEVDGTLFFTADDGPDSRVLLATDGTAGGTRVVWRPSPGEHPGPTFLKAAGGLLFFTAFSPATGTELWRSDGTAAGTRLVADLVPGKGSPRFLELIAAPAGGGGRLVFIAEAGTGGQELWVSDGTAHGTRALTRFANPSALNDHLAQPLFYPITAVGNRLLVPANDGEHGLELWATNGRRAGTRMILDVCPGSCSGVGGWVVGAEGRVEFAGDDSQTGLEPWTTDGTPAGTHLVEDLCAGECGSYPTQPLVQGSRTFFIAGYPFHLWSSDGTAAGMVQVADSGAGPLQGVALANGIVFAGADAAHGQEPWWAEATPGGARLLLDVARRDSGGSFPQLLFALNGRALFLAQDAAQTWSLWASDGSAAGTVRLSGLGPFGVSLAPYAASGLAGGLGFIFLYAEDRQSFNLWRTDGTSEGTFQLSPPGVQVVVAPVRAAGGRIYFLAALPGGRVRLWQSDGTTAGTRPVPALSLARGFTGFGELTTFQDRLWLIATERDGRRALVRTDGSLEGTAVIVRFPPNPDPYSPGPSFTELAGHLYFFIDDGIHGRELWSTDGTPEGTAEAVELAPGPRSFPGSGMVSLLDRLLMQSYDPLNGAGLWASDGTSAGTQKLAATPFSSPAAFSDGIAFIGLSSFSQSLWQSDGTPGGTAPLLGDENGNRAIPASLAALGDSLVFWGLVRIDGYDDYQPRLWQSDGTLEGTALLHDPGIELPYLLSYGARLLPVEDRIFFAGYSAESGWELWAAEP